MVRRKADERPEMALLTAFRVWSHVKHHGVGNGPVEPALGRVPDLDDIAEAERVLGHSIRPDGAA